MTDGSYDPTKVHIITSVNEIVVSIASNDATQPVENVIIDNVAIQHGAWNIGRTEQVNSASAAFLTSVALFIANAPAILISNVEISHTDSYGLRIREGTLNGNFTNSLVNDIGACGVWMTDISILANSNKILSNEISYGGNVFPSSVGVLVFHSFGIVIADNTIHHHRYNENICWFSKWLHSIMDIKDFNLRNLYIYNIGQHILCDQGDIYTIDIQPGTVIHSNVYLDDGASDMIVSNNVVSNTGGSSMFQHDGANNTIINNVVARASLIQPPQPGDPMPDGDVRIQLAENHTSWIYTRNIVYDTFQGTNHSVFKSDPHVIASFSNNVYYNSYGTPLLFGSKQTSFFEWQKSGQHNGSVIADRLFAGDVNQCDFFTVQLESSAAKLKFVNLTKRSTWTPGCSVDDGIDHNQLYHW
ncbi:unnamed protein product [Rotaria sp. Silwood1]|nr:unnamed protein product [Rotaria sp. Silwood1]CAF4871269.1 unnamed protein product [Rotaria sp. Silwood1]